MGANLLEVGGLRVGENSPCKGVVSENALLGRFCIILLIFLFYLVIQITIPKDINKGRVHANWLTIKYKPTDFVAQLLIVKH